MRRKTASLLLVLALLLGLAPGFAAQTAEAAAAQLTFTASVDKTTVSAGESATVTVTVTTASSVSFDMLDAKVSYGADGYFTAGNIQGNVGTAKLSGKKVQFSATEPVTFAAGETKTLGSFDITANGAVGKVDITISDASGLYNGYLDSAEVTRHGTSIEIESAPTLDKPYRLTMAANSSDLTVEIKLGLVSGAAASYQNVASFDFALNYPTDKLTLKSVELNSAVPSGFGTNEGNYVSWSGIATPLKVSAAGTTIATARFEKVDGATGKAAISFADGAMVTQWDNYLENALDGKTDATLDLGNVPSPTPTPDKPYRLTMAANSSSMTVAIQLSLEANAAASYEKALSFDFTIDYPTSQLKLTELKIDDSLAAAGIGTVSGNTVSYGSLTSFAVSTAAKTIATAKFEKVGSPTSATVSFADGAMVCSYDEWQKDSLGGTTGATFSWSTGGGGGGGGSTKDTGTSEAPISYPNAATTTVTTTGSDHTGTVTGNNAKELLDQVKKGKTPMVIIIDVPEDAKSMDIKLPGDVVKSLADGANEDLTIASSIGSVTITAEGLDELAAIGGDVNVRLTLDGNQRATVTLLVDGMEVSDLKGGIIVDFPTLRSSEDGSLLKEFKSSSGTGSSEDILVYSAVKADGSRAKLKGSATVVLRSEGKTFADVAGRWMEVYVKFATARGILKGGDDGLFSPDKAVTRAEIAQVLYNIEGTPSVQAGGAYADVEDYRWYADAAAWAKQAGIITGDIEGNFNAGAAVSREMLAKILYTYAQYLGIDTTADEAALNAFPDAGNVGGWAKEMMVWSVSEGLFQGAENYETGELELLPKNDVTRAAMSKIMQSFIEGLVLDFE